METGRKSTPKDVLIRLTHEERTSPDVGPSPSIIIINLMLSRNHSLSIELSRYASQTSQRTPISDGPSFVMCLLRY